MSTTTPNLGLFKYDTSTDGKEIFSIQTALNNNWDILDTMSSLPDQTGKSGYLLTTDGTEASWEETDEIYPVVQTYVDGTSWYRVYSDGWCEQGGYKIGSGSELTTVNLLKTYANTNYCVYFCETRTGTQSHSGSDNSQVKLGYITKSSFGMYINTTTGNGIFWKTCGYIEVE